MIVFLMNYNFNDVRLLLGAMDKYASRFRELFKVDIHADLSIAKIAQNVAFSMYQPGAPYIYSIPKEADFYYRDCRAKLSGGIVQVFHRAQYLSKGDNPADLKALLPESCYKTPNGEIAKCTVMYDFSSLYPAMMLGFIWVTLKMSAFLGRT